MPAFATAPRPQRRASAADPAPRDHRRPTRDARQLAQRDAKVRAGHRRFRTGLWHYFWRGDMPTLLTAPVVYTLAVGLIAYVREVAARTEQYWCPIRHARRVRHPHDRYETFAAYGDPLAYYHRLPRLRESLRK